MMKIRIIALITLITMIFTILTGCKPQGDDSGVKPEAKLSLDKQNIELNIGETYQLKATISPNGDVATNVTWASAKADVATVSDGLITAVSKGVATISATTADGLFASCYVIVSDPSDDYNQNDSPNTQVPEGSYDGSEVTITFYHTMNSGRLQPVLNEYIIEFNKLYPNIHIVHQNVGGYDDMYQIIQSEIMVGNQPNIAYCYPEHVATYNIAMAVVPLNEFIDSQLPVVDAQGNVTILGLTDAQKADFIPGFYAEGAVFDDEGTMYSLPFSKSTEVLYYNKTFFEQNNLSVPTTWDEMEDVCEQIKEIDPSSIPFSYDSEANWFINMCMQYGADYTQLDPSGNNDYFKFDNPTTRAFVERFKDWYDKGYFTTSSLYGGYTSSLFTNAAGSGGEQRCYMIIGSSAGASYQQSPLDSAGNPYFETGVAMIPQVDTENPKVISQGPSLCIFKQDNPQEVIASWLFVEFLTTNMEFQARFSMQSGYTPVIQSVFDNEIYSEWLSCADGYNNLIQTVINLSINQMDAYYTCPAFHGSQQVRGYITELMVNVFVSSRNDIQTLIDEEFKKAMEKCKYEVQ